MHFDTIIQNGTIVTVDNIFEADIGIQGEKIAAIGTKLETQNAKLIDAAGKLVFPGGIDVHTHLDLPVGNTKTKDDFATGTIAAAMGGTTTIIDFCTQEKGETLNQALQNWHAKAKDKAVIDYGFHIAITDMRADILQEMAALIPNGYPSYKLYMTYSFRVNDEELLQALACAREYGGLVCVHAENYYAIKYFTEKFKQEGKTTPQYHPLSRPPLVEAEATARAIKLARMVDAPLYVVHVSCKEALDEIALGRTQGAKIMAETCPQYLTLSQDNYNLPDFEGAKFVISPPLRAPENQKYLWQGIKANNLLVVSSDHCPFDFKGQKDLGRNFFADIPNGAPGIEARMSLLFDRGVNAGNISLQKYVELTATNPAKIFGMYPQKGTIDIGSDADILIFDPKLKKTISKAILHENVDYTPYESFTITGFPVMTLSRGEVITRDGEFVSTKGRGKFLPRKCGVVI